MSEKLPNSAKELMQLYGVSRTTWGKYLKPLRNQIRHFAKVYTPKELSVIIDHLGTP